MTEMFQKCCFMLFAFQSLTVRKSFKKFNIALEISIQDLKIIQSLEVGRRKDKVFFSDTFKAISYVKFVRFDGICRRIGR